MLASLSLWALTVALGQSPAPVVAGAEWLKAVPADVDVAVRVRGVEATRADLMAMLKAMSPGLAERAEASLTGPLGQFRETFGEDAVKPPWVGLIRAVVPGGDGSPPFAILVLKDDYPAVLKSIGKDKAPELVHQEGGYDAFKSPKGEQAYAVKGPGFVAFGPDEALIAAIAKPGEKTLDKALTPELAGQFLAGDVGVYVNAGPLIARHADQIEDARQKFMGALDQAGQQGGNAATMDMAKEIYGGLFDSLKDAAALSFNLDVSVEGLNLGGALAVKPGSGAAKVVAASTSGIAADLAALPQDSAFYVYMNMDATTINRMQGMSMRMMSPGGKPTDNQVKVLAQLGELGRIETVGSVAFANGMRGLNVVKVADPEKYIAVNLAMMQAMKEGELSNFYKDVKIDPKAGTYQGIAFSHIVLTLDLEKMAKLNPNNPSAAAAMKSMFGGETMSSWLGTDGKKVFQATTPTWNDVKAQVDAFLKGNAGIGSLAGYKSVRSRLPDQSSFLMLASAQGLVRMMATQLALTLNKPDLKAPADLPSEPVFFGGSLTPRPPSGYEFHLVLPSKVGPVLEKGLVPLFQGVQGPGQP
jgi:hypothetical protein